MTFFFQKICWNYFDRFCWFWARKFKSLTLVCLHCHVEFSKKNHLFPSWIPSSSNPAFHHHSDMIQKLNNPMIRIQHCLNFQNCHYKSWISSYLNWNLKILKMTFSPKKFLCSRIRLGTRPWSCPWAVRMLDFATFARLAMNHSNRLGIQGIVGISGFRRLSFLLIRILSICPWWLNVRNLGELRDLDAFRSILDRSRSRRSLIPIADLKFHIQNISEIQRRNCGFFSWKVCLHF